MPLRYRMRGAGKRENAATIYAKRVAKVWGNAFGKWATASVLTHLLTPYALILVVFFGCLNGFGLPIMISIGLAATFYLLYRFVDLFRYIFEISVARTISILMGIFFIKKLKQEAPDYEQPAVFQTLK